MHRTLVIFALSKISNGRFLFIQEQIFLIPNDYLLCLSLILPTTACANIFSFNSSHLLGSFFSRIKKWSIVLDQIPHHT